MCSIIILPPPVSILNGKVEMIFTNAMNKFYRRKQRFFKNLSPCPAKGRKMPLSISIKLISSVIKLILPC